MSLPPERISIKRRRQEEPVDTLVLERGSSKDHKRRLTDVYFKRLSDDAIQSKSTVPPLPQASALTKPSQHHRAISDQHGIPTVRATLPGDEVKDFVKAIAAQKQRQEPARVSSPAHATNSMDSEPATTTASRDLLPTEHVKAFKQARRFHLSRDHSQTSRPNSPSGIRKHRSGIRPPLATFVERHTITYTNTTASIHKQPPIDKIVSLIEANNADGTSVRETEPADLARVDAAARTTTQTFVKPTIPITQLGRSIKDHPSTWDRESDQLADELAALAMELDPMPEHRIAESRQRATMAQSSMSEVIVRASEDDDYIYETYIRIKHSENGGLADLIKTPADIIGVLVIEEQDEELWGRYAEEEDESEWDDEDSNAEDNPANDYPEDEVSSDDEFDHNAYKYRQHASDDEEFDEDDENDN